jgi:hypothetical protein
MTIDRMTIIVEDKLNHKGTININGEELFNCNLDWLEQYPCDHTGVPASVHAVQWYGDHGEIELTTRGSNIVITELGSLGIATSYFEQRRIEFENEQIIAEKERLSDEEIALQNQPVADALFDELLNQLLNEEEVTPEAPTE